MCSIQSAFGRAVHTHARARTHARTHAHAMAAKTGRVDMQSLRQTPHDLLGGMFTWTHAVGFAVGTALTEDAARFRSNWALWLAVVLLLNAVFENLVTGTTYLRLLKQDGAQNPTSRIVYTVLVTIRLMLGWAIVTIVRNVVQWTLESNGFMGIVNLAVAIVVLYSVFVFLNPLDADFKPASDGVLVPIREATLRGAVPGTVPVATLHSLTNIDHAEVVGADGSV